MKNILFILTVTFYCSPAFAQQLPTDENGKISFLKVVKADSLKSGVLYFNAKTWLSVKGYVIEKTDSIGGQIVAKYVFPVYDKGYVTKKLNGKISCNLILEVKDNKYRYQFTDFVFAYFKEDRNYKFVATGKKKNLEEPAAKGWQPLWDQHKKTTLSVINDQAASLKSAMVFIAKAPEITEKKKTIDW